MCWLRVGERRSEVTLAVDFTLADPHLDTKDTDLRQSFSLSVVNVCTKRVQRRTAFLVHLGASDFCTIQTT